MELVHYDIAIIRPGAGMGPHSSGSGVHYERGSSRRGLGALR